MRPLARVAAVVAAPLLAVPAGAAPAAPADRSSARAVAVRVVLPAGDGEGTAAVSAPPDAVQVGGTFAYPDDGSIVTTGPVTASVSLTAGVASGSSEAASVSLFGGEVTVERVAGRAAADERTGSTAGSSVEGLVVAGVPVEAPAGQIPLGDWGFADVLVQASERSARGQRRLVTALAIRLTADHGGLPAGSSILLGHAEAVAIAAPKPALPVVRKPVAPAPAVAPRRAEVQVAPPPARPRATVPPIVRRPLPSLVPKLTKKGYVFPVHGPASFADTFGASRAVVGWHHGEDIFAPMGAPALAVAAGTVFSVGWNELGGNRLWLRDRKGNEFYYAHLSAFSPLAVDGAHVQAGDVLGFVGNSGDAEQTPPHLHFEIHPVGLLALGYDGVVNPYPYLLAWKRLEDVRFISGASWVPSLAQVSDAPTPGAFLLSARDISVASSLAAGEVARVLEPGPSAET